MNEDDGPCGVVVLNWALMIALGASLLHLVLFTPLRRYPGEPDGYR